ncbi:MAG: hypothetical protein ACYS30_25490 [Planctomycetota bacterium]|jgi:hypothetical protein
MFRDRTLVWAVEYIFGGTLVVVPLTSLVLCRAAQDDAHIWAAQLFVVCLGVILISCASSMRQRILLARRIDILAKQIAGSSGSSDLHDENRQGPPF